jgi:hypothetical protein
MMDMSSNVVTLGNFTHNRPPTSKDDYIAAIHGWVAEKRDALSRKEIGAMEAFDRVDAQRKAYLIGLSQYYRANPRADVAPGVFAIITFLSDNEAGVCTVAQANIGKILGRSRTAIAEASARLTKSGLIEVTPKRAISSPVIPRAVTTSYNHLAWLIEALAADVPSKGHDDVPPSRHLMSRQADMSEQTCPVEADQHVPSTGHNFTKENSTATAAAREREPDKPLPLKIAASIAASVLAATAPLPVAAHPADVPSITQQAPLSKREMVEQMFDAAGRVLHSPASRPKLMLAPELDAWLEAGCDFGKDILPVIRVISGRQPPGTVKSWNYFADAIADARRSRVTPMPEGRDLSGKPPQRSFAQQKADAERAALARDVAEIRSRGPAKPLYEQIEDFLS